MKKVLELIEGKWDYFGIAPEFRKDLEYFAPSARWFLYEGKSDKHLYTYSLNDFANNKSVVNALQELRNPKTWDIKDILWIHHGMIDFLYNNPHDAEGLEKLILEWIGEKK